MAGWVAEPALSKHEVYDDKGAGTKWEFVSEVFSFGRFSQADDQGCKIGAVAYFFGKGW